MSSRVGKNHDFYYMNHKNHIYHMNHIDHDIYHTAENEKANWAISYICPRFIHYKMYPIQSNKILAPGYVNNVLDASKELITLYDLLISYRSLIYMIYITLCGP